jgi:hypothetical protein
MQKRRGDKRPPPRPRTARAVLADSTRGWECCTFPSRGGVVRRADDARRGRRVRVAGSARVHAAGRRDNSERIAILRAANGSETERIAGQALRSWFRANEKKAQETVLKLAAAADGSPDSKHTQDLIAMAPTAAELASARVWVVEQDALEEFVEIVDEAIEHVLDH